MRIVSPTYSELLHQRGVAQALRSIAQGVHARAWLETRLSATVERSVDVQNNQNRANGRLVVYSGELEALPVGIDEVGAIDRDCGRGIGDAGGQGQDRSE